MSTDKQDDLDSIGGIVEEFAVIMEGADRTVRKYVNYRHELLWVHAIAATLMGTLMFNTPRSSLVGPSTAFLRAIPGSPQSLAVLLAAGGFLLSIGLVFTWFNVKRAALGMLALFYLLIAVSLAVPIVQWLFGGAPAPVLYGWILYLHMAAIMVVHIGGTFRRRKR